MNSSTPYLLRALNEWILDNNLTPYLVVDVARDGVEVPMAFAKDGRIILNIGPSAIRDFDIGPEWISFHGRFSGVSHHVLVPVEAVLGIVAKENGEGMWFRADGASAKTEAQTPSPGPTDTPPGPSKGSPKKGGPSLKVVK